MRIHAALILFTIVGIASLSGCVTSQDPINKMCSIDIVRGELTIEQCIRDLSNTYYALKNSDMSKCSEIGSTSLKENCLQSVGKYSFLGWVRSYFELSDSEIDNIFSSLTAESCSEDCSAASINLSRIFIHESGHESEAWISNNGACDIAVSTLKVYNGENVLCEKNLNQELIKGGQQVFRFDCTMKCREFTRATVTTECGQVSGEITNEGMDCDTTVVMSSELCSKIFTTDMQIDECVNNQNLVFNAIYTGKVSICNFITYDLWRTTCPDWIMQYKDPEDWYDTFFGFTDTQTYSICDNMDLIAEEKNMCNTDLRIMKEAIENNDSNICKSIASNLWRTNCPSFVNQFRNFGTWYESFFGISP